MPTALVLLHCQRMYFPKFWARGEHEGQLAWRWSDSSLAEAQAFANEAAQRLADQIRHGDIPRRERGYYPGRPFREQTLREIRNGNGELLAVITRNSYGCLVLNTSRTMFVDVDLPEPKAPGLLARLFGRPTISQPTENESSALARLELWTQRNPDWGWRIYRTRAGLRFLATHALFDPETVASDGVFDALGADPLYRQLCKTQKCFRARLTPKPWRCGIHRKPERWPWLTPKAEKRFQAWEEKYQATFLKWATCEFVRSAGNRNVLSDLESLIKLHDEMTNAESKLPLA